MIRVSGTITCSGMLRVRSNKTILGNSGATIAGCGLNISGDRNVIIRNLTFRDWNDDAINVEQSATNIWIDHNTFSNGYDGAVDIKRGSDFVTVSWNRVFNHDKSMLLGHSDDNAQPGHRPPAGHLPPQLVRRHQPAPPAGPLRQPGARLQQLLQQHRRLRRRLHR